jgi:hypothetical protein
MKTCQIINKPKHPKKGGIQGTKWKDSHQKTKKKPPKRANHKENMKFTNPLLS